MTSPAMKWNGNLNEEAIENVTKIIKKNGIEIVDFKFNDLPGLCNTSRSRPRSSPRSMTP